MIYIGIDNGLKGALTAVSAHSGLIIERCVMPVQGKAKGDEVDCRAVTDWLSDICAFDCMSVLLETPGKHSPGTNALCSMWDSYGSIRSILETRGIRHHRIAPQTWQSSMLGKIAKGHTKPAALSKARQLWPQENFFASSRCRTPHDGIIDAALIAEYGRLKNL